MARDRGASTHFFAALLVTVGILSFGLLEWRLSKTLSHHPTEHEGDGPWLKPRVYHRRRNSEGVGSGASSAAGPAAATLRAQRLTAATAPPAQGQSDDSSCGSHSTAARCEPAW